MKPACCAHFADSRTGKLACEFAVSASLRMKATSCVFFLHSAAQWCDYIYVLDNGSSDDTWAITQDLARTCPKIVAFRQDDQPFTDTLRAEVFNAYAEHAEVGDWWCRLDADEIYIDNPQSFLRQQPQHYQVVWSIHLQYYLTELDLVRFDPENSQAPEMTEATLPRYYVANASEGRFFRHRPRLRWSSGYWPRHLGLSSLQPDLIETFPIPLAGANSTPFEYAARIDGRRRAEGVTLAKG